MDKNLSTIKMLSCDWSEYERLVGEFLRTYIEGDNLQVMDKLKALGGGATHLVQRRQKTHKVIRNLINHGAYIGHSEDGAHYQPCLMTVSFAAQMFLGLGFDHPVQISKKWWDLNGGMVMVDNLKKGIGEMRVAALVAAEAVNVGRVAKGRTTPKGRRLMKLKWRPNRNLPLTHIESTWDAERNEMFHIDRYDENASGLEEWRDLDQAVGAFLRAWSEILVSLRELELMINNPNGPSRSLDISSESTDMKRAEKVLGSGHPVTCGLMGMAKERALIVHGDRMVEGIVDRSRHAEGGVWVCSAQNIRDYTEPIRLAVKEVQAVVDERKTEWGGAPERS